KKQAPGGARCVRAKQSRANRRRGLLSLGAGAAPARKGAVRGGPLMRVLAIGLALAVLVFVVSGGHVLFLPLLFLPLGLLSLGHRRRQQPSSFRRDRLMP